MRSTPHLSVLLPVYNAAPWLEECLRSLADQTLVEFEVVAVDDGSTDGSGRILHDWAARDPRLRILRHSHGGLIAALNRGLAACRGELVARMDADDLAHPQRLELQMEALVGDSELDVVSCLVSHFPPGSVGEGFRIYEQWLNRLVEHEEILRERFIESPLPHPTVMARRTAFEQAGGYRATNWPEDYDLWLRMAAAGRRFRKVPRVLYFWRNHDDRLTRTHPRYAVERFLACKAHHLVRGPLRESGSVILWGAGQTGRRLSKHLLRLEAPLSGFIDINPGKIGRTLRGLPIHPAEDLPALLRRCERPVILVAVSSRGARALIREHLEGLGLVEGGDYWCAA